VPVPQAPVFPRNCAMIWQAAPAPWCFRSKTGGCVKIFLGFWAYAP